MGRLAAILALLVTSLWLPEVPDPRRAGTGESAPTLCPETDCTELLRAAGDLLVCRRRHVFMWDEESCTLVKQGT